MLQGFYRPIIPPSLQIEVGIIKLCQILYKFIRPVVAQFIGRISLNDFEKNYSVSIFTVYVAFFLEKTDIF